MIWYELVNMKKILPYLLINVAVSAITMLAVILIWSAFHPSPLKGDSVSDFTSANAHPTETSLPSLDQPTVEIQSVFLPGEMDYEKISIKNVSEAPVDLTGWSLTNDEDDRYVFPTLTLYPNGALEVWTKAGINTAVELFWNAPNAIWSSGGRAILLDSAGQERSRLSIP